jgi:hypothetical protein
MAPEAAETVQHPAGRAKRLLRVLAAVLAGVLAVGASILLVRAWPILFPRPGITRLNVQRIRRGMTRGEVEAILGGPAGDYRTVATAYLPEARPLGPWAEKEVYADSVWKADTGAVWVRFDFAGRVAGISDQPNAVFYWESQEVRINPEGFSRIQEGMSREEVAFVLGGRAGDYRVGPAVWYPDIPDSLAKTGERVPATGDEPFKEFWQGNEGCIYVEYARLSGRVKSKQYWAGKRRE